MQIPEVPDMETSRIGTGGKSGRTHVLLLGGTGEARDLAGRLERDHRFRVTYSLAGRIRQPVSPPGLKTRIGGFRSAGGLRAFLQDKNVDIVVDATHPFAERMTLTAHGVSRELGTSHIVLRRPAWCAGPGDRWHPVSGPDDLRGLIPRSATVLLTTGRQTLKDFGSALAGRKVLARVIDPPSEPFPYPERGGNWIVGRPPFSVDSEMELFRREGIDWLVTKNAGGPLSRSKLDAARRLSIPVAVVERPGVPDCRVVETVAACMEWLESEVARPR
ncbi:MAG: cobalt-precorrin-6A reductase [Paracoccaceae bacterium]|nr:cobalt-precorrin-6A reductase [Paracoccaceae bacterium]